MIKSTAITCAILISTSCLAGISIFGAKTEESHDAQASLTIEQRINRVEQQIENQNTAKILACLEETQQALQDLRGQLEMQEHQLQVLQEQQKTFYADLDRRISQTSQVAAPSSDNVTVEQSIPMTSDKASYQMAYALVKDRQFPQATKAMQAVIRDFPKSPYAANAHYWLGELYLSQQQTENAKDELNIVINEFPESPKVADARLKLGFIYFDAGEKTQARTELVKVKKQYPNTTAARLAASKLREIH